MTDTDTRLTAQQIEGRLTAALATIETQWDQMLTPPSSGAPGPRTHGTGVALADDSEAEDDMPRLVRVLEARREVVATLRSWCQVVVEDHNATHAIPNGGDAVGMARFLTRWSYLMAEHEAAEDLLSEVRTARGLVERYAPPSSPPPENWRPPLRTMRLGACPLKWQNPETSDDQPCPGSLKGDEFGWVTCDKCGTQAVMGWWEQQLDEDQRAGLMTLEDVRLYLHRRHGMRLTLSALRMWVRRDHLVRSDEGEQGQSLYDVAAVEAALTRRERMPRHV